MTATVLVTGGAGFIGSAFVRHVINNRDDLRVVNLDLLTYAGNLENLTEVEGSERYRFVRGDIGDRELLGRIFDEEDVSFVVNFAAETHVDRSIMGGESFVSTNVLGTQTLLEATREAGMLRFLQVSTDEVYGSLGETGSFVETSPLDPSSPYSASKAAADLLVLAAWKTHGQPVLVTRCSNNYGPYQFPEKLIPLMIVNAMAGRQLPVYGDGLNVRDWIHADDHSRAVETVLFKGRPGEVYNVGGGNERPNIWIVKKILEILGRPEELIRFVKDRPGHDRRYAIDHAKLTAELGWRPEVDFAEGLRRTVEWYKENAPWWERVRSGAYREYYEKNYGWR